jgi:predicted small lipoprotein YifL
MRNYLSSFIAIAILILLAGCTSHNSSGPLHESSTPLTKSHEEYTINDKDLKQLVILGLAQRLDKKVEIKDLKLDYPYYEGSAIFSTFYITTHQKVELGLVYAEWRENEYSLQFIDLFPVDERNPFSVISTSGKLYGDKKEFKAYFGYVIDKTINEVRISFKNNITNSVTLKNSNKTFLDVVTGKKVAEKTIEARDSKDQLVYKYDY